MNKMAHLTFAKIEIRKMNQKWKSQVKNGDEKQKAEVEIKNENEKQKSKAKIKNENSKWRSGAKMIDRENRSAYDKKQLFFRKF